MAFNTNTAVNNTASNAQDPAWKASGFINFYLPTANGERRKVGAIPLKDAKPNEKALLAWLLEDPAHVQKFMNKLEVDVQSVVPTEGSGFDLS